MEQDYFTTNYNQVVSLVNKANSARKVACTITSENPFLCALVGENDISKLTSQTPLNLVKDFKTVIDTAKSGYLVFRSASDEPNRIIVKTENYTGKSSSKSIFTNWIFWILIALAVLAILAVGMMIIKSSKKKGVELVGAYDAAKMGYKTGGKTGAVKQVGKAFRNNLSYFD